MIQALKCANTLHDKVNKTPLLKQEHVVTMVWSFPTNLHAALLKLFILDAKYENYFHMCIYTSFFLVLRTFFQNKMYTTFQLINSVFQDKKRFNARYKSVVTNFGYLEPNFK